MSKTLHTHRLAIRLLLVFSVERERYEFMPTWAAKVKNRGERIEQRP
jgi:hypothetical protein